MWVYCHRKQKLSDNGARQLYRWDHNRQARVRAIFLCTALGESREYFDPRNATQATHQLALTFSNSTPSSHIHPDNTVSFKNERYTSTYAFLCLAELPKLQIDKQRSWMRVRVKVVLHCVEGWMNPRYLDWMWDPINCNNELWVEDGREKRLCEVHVKFLVLFLRLT